MKRKVTSPKPEPPYFDEKGYFHFRLVTSDARHAVRLKPFPVELAHWFQDFQGYKDDEYDGLKTYRFDPPHNWDKIAPPHGWDEFYTPHIWNKLKERRDTRWRYNARIRDMLQSLRDEAESAASEVIVIPEFEEMLYKSDLLFLIDHVQEEMCKNLQWS